MLYRASVSDIKTGRVSKRYGYLAVVMQYYPRFVKKELIDEYLHDLAPDRELFTEFKEKDRALKDHDRAFREVRYEERFTVGASGADQLKRLSGLAKERDVYLLCQCGPLEHCHADLLLLLARHWFGARTQTVRVKYPAFEKRIAAGELPCPATH